MSLSVHRRHRRCHVIVMMFLIGTVWSTGTGCRAAGNWKSRGWVADYDSAELRVGETGREMLILYVDPRPGESRVLQEALDTPIIKRRIRGYVRCRLFKSYEPDRRYVAQFGVERAPALIVVHGDGTYHALTGAVPADVVYNFLGGATAPGRAVALNRHIPRRASYHWHGDAGSARQASGSTGKPILFVFRRRFTRDWRRLEKILSRGEVYDRFADMVHCRLSTLNPWTKIFISEFGVLRLPALVIAHGDGTHDILETPTGYEAVVRFADQSCARGATASARSAPKLAEP